MAIKGSIRDRSGYKIQGTELCCVVWGSHHPFPAGGKGRALARSVVLGERLARWVELTPPVGTISYRGKSYKKPLLSVWPLPCQATSPLRVSLIGWAEQGCSSLVYSEPPAYVRTAKQGTPPRSHLCHLSASTQEAAVQQGAIFCHTSQPLRTPLSPYSGLHWTFITYPL